MSIYGNIACNGSTGAPKSIKTLIKKYFSRGYTHPSTHPAPLLLPLHFNIPYIGLPRHLCIFACRDPFTSATFPIMYQQVAWNMQVNNVGSIPPCLEQKGAKHCGKSDFFKPLHCSTADIGGFWVTHKYLKISKQIYDMKITQIDSFGRNYWCSFPNFTIFMGRRYRSQAVLTTLLAFM